MENFSFKEVAAESGSRSTTGGGAWYRNNAECSQSFSYESPDVNMDVSDIVNNWLDNSISNNGLILKWSGSQEDSTDYSGDINFFSSDAQSIYSPKIEVRWDKHIACSGSNTGSLTQLTIDGTNDNYHIENSHVIPAIIRKIYEAKISNAENIKVWGSGRPKREFLHVDDLAEVCVVLLKHYDRPEVINVGVGQETSIAWLARKLKCISGFRGGSSF